MSAERVSPNSPVYPSDFFTNKKFRNEVPPEKGAVLVIAETSVMDIYNGLTLNDEKILLTRLGKLDPEFMAQKIDIIVLDSGMDVRNGLRVLKEVKAVRIDIPVIFLAEFPAKDLEREAIKAGARFYLAKPVNIFHLKNLVGKLLSLKRTSREKRVPILAGDTEKEGLPQATTDQPVNIIKVMQYIEENLAEKISLENLSKEASMSKFHFCRFFYRHAGLSPIKFLNQARIEKAKEYLQKERITISEVSHKVGYNDLGTFIRQFKKLTGLTPSAYQESCRKFSSVNE